MIIAPGIDMPDGKPWLPEVWFAALRCACGSADLFAVTPGQEDEAVDVSGQQLPIRRGERMQASCESCHPLTRESAA